MNLTSQKRLLALIIVLSLGTKLALFAWTANHAPEAKFMPDTPTYVEPGINIIEKGVFGAIDKDGNVHYEMRRTPGYPLFIGILHKGLGLSFNGIIIVQILLITFAGWIVYKAACEIDKRIALLAAFIFLFDQPVTIASIMVLTEALYTVFIAVFMYLFLKYLKVKRLRFLSLSVLTLALATYIRPVSFYLGVCVAGGALYVMFGSNMKKAIVHALVAILIFYSCVGVWHYRNYVRCGRADFTTLDELNLSSAGLLHKYERVRSRGKTELSPFVFYVNRSLRSVSGFITLPGTLKQFGSWYMRRASKIFGYPWLVFWLAGLCFVGLGRIEYKFLMMTVLYYLVVSVLIVGIFMSSRYRVPVMPLISILSAAGWLRISKRLL